jgi:hypothetical protein
MHYGIPAPVFSGQRGRTASIVGIKHPTGLLLTKGEERDCSSVCLVV